MNVVRDTTVIGLVKEAIMTYAANNQAISQIELTEAEMKEFYKSPKVTTDTSSYFGGSDSPLITGIEGIKQKGDVPKSLYYQGVRIILKD